MKYLDCLILLSNAFAFLLYKPYWICWLLVWIKYFHNSCLIEVFMVLSMNSEFLLTYYQSYFVNSMQECWQHIINLSMNSEFLLTYHQSWHIISVWLIFFKLQFYYFFGEFWNLLNIQWNASAVSSLRNGQGLSYAKLSWNKGLLVQLTFALYQL